MSTSWFVNISGQSVGPLTTEAVTAMLLHNRFHFVDFIWCEQMEDWARIFEVEQFAQYMPQLAVDVGDQSVEEQEVVAEALVEELVEPEQIEEQIIEEEPAPPAAPPAPKPRPVLHAVPVSKPQAPKDRPAPKPVYTARAAAAATQPVSAPATALKQSVAPRAVAKQVAKPVVKPVVKSVPKRQWRVPIDARVTLEGYGDFAVLDISEGGMMIEASTEIAIGTELRVKVESPSFPRALDMTALLVRHETFEQKSSYGIEFTKVNPAHKRTLASYVKAKLSIA